MGFNPRPKPCEVIPSNKVRELQAQAEVDANKRPLKPIPHNIRKPGKKLEYYIELWKLGNATNDKHATMFKTANIKHVLSLILKAGHTIVYLMRVKDKKVIWDKR